MYIKQFKIKGNNIIEIIDSINDDLKIISYNPAEGSRSKNIEDMIKGICENKGWNLIETKSLD